ncbi:MFS transporter [Pseudonocardia sp. HH130629-09]|uniref:MFS transporter n=1 Tax=Pseudonocardia sp. HH130629-09 TaxID=1641402 RepID=UPI0007617CC6|nr:MFS transporter [Pseudonocardia sp. HH130629-09]
MAAVGAALVVVSASSPSLGIALPELAGDIGASQAETTWISTVGSVVSAAVLLPAGAAADRWGRRRFLMAGLLLFGLAEVATASVSQPELVIALRALVGLASAVVLPVTLAVLVAAFPREQRARAVAVWATTVSVSASVAGLASGQLTTEVSWRVMPIVLGAAALLLVVPLRLTLPERRDAAATSDPLGGLLILIGIGALVLGIGQAGQGPATAPAVLVPLLVGLVGIVGFVLWELRTSSPMLPVRLFTGRALPVGTVLLLLITGAFSAYTFIGVQYLQNVRGLTPLETALTFLVTEAGVVSGAVFVPWLVRRFGVRLLGSVGATLVGVAFLALAASAGLSAFWPFAAGLALLGVGFALSSTPASTLVVSGLPPARLGVASAVNNVGRDIGGAVGVALVGAVLLAVYQSRVAPTLAGLPPPSAEQVGSGITSAAGAAGDLGPAADGVLDAARQAFLAGFQAGATAAAALAFAAALLCAVFAPRGIRTARDISPELEPEPAHRTGTTDHTRRTS